MYWTGEQAGTLLLDAATFSFLFLLLQCVYLFFPLVAKNFLHLHPVLFLLLLFSSVSSVVGWMFACMYWTGGTNTLLDVRCLVLLLLFLLQQCDKI